MTLIDPHELVSWVKKISRLEKLAPGRCFPSLLSRRGAAAEQRGEQKKEGGS
jgi:hypothetical protein